MEGGVLQSVKTFLTALASHSSRLIRDQIDSTIAEINHVSESVTEALQLVKKFSQKIDERLEERRQFGETIVLGRFRNNDEEESGLDGLSSFMVFQKP